MIPNFSGMVPNTGQVSRALLGPDAKNWSFLGQVIGPAGVTVGPVVWVGTFEEIYWQYWIQGYSGGAIGRQLIGAASISTTGTTNGNKLIEDVTANATSVSVPGCPLAVTVANVARSGHGVIMGASGQIKRIIIQGAEGPFAANSAPVHFTAESAFDDGAGNLPIQRMQLTVYDTITATSVSTTTFGGTTSLKVWGRNND